MNQPMNQGPRRLAGAELAPLAPWRGEAHLSVVAPTPGDRLFIRRDGDDRLNRRIAALLDRPLGELVLLAAGCRDADREAVHKATAVAVGAFRHHFRLAYLAEITFQSLIEGIVEPDELRAAADGAARLRTFDLALQAVAEGLSALRSAPDEKAFVAFELALHRATATQMCGLVPFALRAIELGAGLIDSVAAPGAGPLITPEMERRIPKWTDARAAKVLVAVTQDMPDVVRGTQCFLTHDELFELFDRPGAPPGEGWQSKRDIKRRRSAAAALSRDIRTNPGLRGIAPDTPPDDTKAEEDE